jgi:enterochelin esterase-like enzyme
MTAFKSIAVSDPRFEQDNLRYITVKSKNLKGRGDISVFVPPGEMHQDLPMVLLLHGVYASHWGWTHLGGVHRQMLDGINKGLIKPMVLVMPSDGLWGDGSGYLPHKDQDFEKWIMEDVISAVIEVIKETSDRSILFIAGLSMGGFGALRLGAKYGTRFKAVSGLSSITHAMQMQTLLDEDITGLLNENGAELSVSDLIVSNRGILPKIRFDCGISDPLIFENRMLHEQLLACNIPHIYEEFNGAHEWAYWEENIFKTLLFFNEQL